jgi:molybdopterin molybdotransferase
MTVEIQIPTPLRRFCAQQDQVLVKAGTVGEAFAELFRLHPDLKMRMVDESGGLYPYLLLFKNETELSHQGLTSVPVQPGDRLSLLSAVVGGSGASESSEAADVRMRGFRDRTSVEDAQGVALAGVEHLAAEQVLLADVRGRVLAADIISPVAVPNYRRSAMDGYAVRAEDTFGSTLYDPVSLEMVGESMPGAAAEVELVRGQVCRIMTGAAVPGGADAVVMAEHCEEVGDQVKISRAVTPGKNVGAIGEDLEAGALVLNTGRRLRPQDLGLLASIGQRQVPVRGRARVLLLLSGNELLAPGSRPEPGKVIDSNSPMLSALIERDGGMLSKVERLPDDRSAMRSALRQARGFDVIVTAGATSVGREDYLPPLVRELGELPVHGVAMRPSAPTGIGRLHQVPIVLLPGNPVSCLCAYDFFAGPILRRLAGLPEVWPYPAVRGRLLRRISSQIGRLDYVRVQRTAAGIEPVATSGASVLSSTTRADGFVVVPAASEGLAEGAEVTLSLYDSWPDQDGPP